MCLKLTKGAPRNAISNGTCFSLVRHWTHGNFAKVVIPEKTASAVTDTKAIVKKLRACTRPRKEHGLTGIITGVCRLVWEPDIVHGHLVFIMAIMTHTGCPEGEHEQREKLGLEDHLVRKESIHYRGLLKSNSAIYV
jgi:hypothetical protein